MDKIGLTAKLTFDGTQAIAAMKTVGTAFTGMTGKIAVTKAGFTQVKQGLSGLGLGGLLAGAGVGLMIKKYAEFDSVMAGMRATLGAEYKKDFPKLEQATRSIAAATGKSVSVVGDAMASLAREGMKPAEIMQAITPTLNAMSASGIDAATAAKLVDTTLEKWGLTAKDAGMATDVMVLAARKSGATLPEFAVGLQQISGTAGLLKIDMKDAAAALGLFVQGGLESGAAAQNLNMALLKMSRASKDGYIAIAGLGKVQIPTKNGALDLEGTMSNIAVALQYVKNPIERVNLAMSLFGMRGRESAQALEKLTKDPAALPEMFRNIRNNSAGATAAMAKLKTEGPAAQFKKLQNAMTNVAIEVGASFLPLMQKATQVIVPLAQQFGQAFRFFTSTPGAVDKVGVAIEGVSPMIIQVTQGLVAGFSGVKTAMGWIASGIQTIGGLFGGGGPGGTGVKTAVEWAVKLGVVAGAYKLLGPVIKSSLNVGVGAAKMLAGALGAIGTASTGVIGLLAKRFPAIAKALPRGAGMLGKVASAAEKITAQPVRIVNWDEAGMGGGAGVAPGQLSLPGMGGPKPPGAPAARPAIGMGVGIAAAVGGGIALNMIEGEVRGPVKTLGNTVLGISAMFGPAGLAVGGIAAGALALGSKIDEWTGASTKISDGLFDWSQSLTAGARAASAALYAQDLNAKAVRDQANALIGFARRGVGVETTPGGGRQKVTEAFMREKLTRGAVAQGMTPEQAASMVRTIMTEMGPKLADAMKGVKVDATLNVDGRPVAKGVAGANQENKERRGQPQAPGSRRRAAS